MQAEMRETELDAARQQLENDRRPPHRSLKQQCPGLYSPGNAAVGTRADRCFPKGLRPGSRGIPGLPAQPKACGICDASHILKRYNLLKLELGSQRAEVKGRLIFDVRRLMYVCHPVAVNQKSKIFQSQPDGRTKINL